MQNLILRLQDVTRLGTSVAHVLTMASSEKEGEYQSGCQFPEQKQTLEEDALQVNGPSIRPGVAAIKSQYVVINSISLYEVESLLPMSI